jgi:pilus assembly protein CpaB
MRTLPIIAVALLLGAVVAFLVARSLSSGGESIESVPVVVAAEPIEPGAKINPLQLRIVRWPVLSRPTGGFDVVADATGRIARAPIEVDEPVVEGKLAPQAARGGLSSIIALGKRAVSVRVNDVIGVAGFALPGSYVDVIVSAKDASEKPFSRIVLSRVRVLAAAQDTGADPSKPKLVNAVTLELTPAEAEKLDLARTIGTLSLVLRNELDQATETQADASHAARLSDLLSSEVVGPVVEAPAAAAPVVKPPVRPRVKSDRPSSAPEKMDELRGTHRSNVSQENP